MNANKEVRELLDKYQLLQKSHGDLLSAAKKVIETFGICGAADARETLRIAIKEAEKYDH